MNKKLLFVLLPGLLFVARLQAQTRRIDTVAVAILDRMSAVIGDLGSCSFTVKSNYDISNKELGLVKHSDEEELYLHGPNKLLLKSDGDRGSREYYFNGQTL